MRKQMWRLAILVLSVLVISSWCFGQKLQKQDSHSKWNAQYLGGAAPIAQQTVMLSINENDLVLTPATGDPFTVNLKNINLVSSRTKGTHPASAAESQFLKAVVSGPGCSDCRGMGVVAFFTAALMLGSYPITSRDYIVSIGWRDGAADEEIVVRLGKHEYQPFLAALEEASGRKWENLDAQWQTVKKELDEQHGTKIPLMLLHDARLSKFRLKAGKYEAVLLQRGETNLLFVFPQGHVDLTHLSVVAEVKVAPAGDSSDPVVYEVRNGALSVVEIRTGSNTIRVD